MVFLSSYVPEYKDECGLYDSESVFDCLQVKGIPDVVHIGP